MRRITSTLSSSHGSGETTAEGRYQGVVTISADGAELGQVKVDLTVEGAALEDHGDSVAKGCAAIRAMDKAALRKRVPDTASDSRAELLEAALEDHVYRTPLERNREKAVPRRMHLVQELYSSSNNHCRQPILCVHICQYIQHSFKRSR